MTEQQRSVERFQKKQEEPEKIYPNTTLFTTNDTLDDKPQTRV
jgi:hypothetical protein